LTYEIDRKAIGGRIKDALIAAGYGQADLARRLGIKDPSVSAYISGKSAISDKAYLIASEMTGKSIDYFSPAKTQTHWFAKPRKITAW